MQNNNMKNSGLSITAFTLILASIVALLAVITFSEGIRRIEWMSLEGAAWACFGLAILGCILGWCSFRSSLGKVSAILGTVLVIGFLAQLMLQEEPRTAPPHTRMQHN